MARISDLEFDIAMKIAVNRCLAAEVESFMKQDTAATEIPAKVEKRVSRKIWFDKWKNARLITAKTLRIAVLCIMCVTTLFFVTTMCIKPVRAAFIGAIVTWYEDYIDVRYTAEATSNGEGEPDFVVLKPTYIPEGWSIVSEHESYMTYNCDMVGIDSRRILYSQHRDSENGTGIDNETCIQELIYLNNDTVEANLFVFPNGSLALIWNDGYMFKFTAENVELDELIKVAESVYANR